MQLLSSLALVAILICSAQANAQVPTGPFGPEPGSEQASFYAANATAITRLTDAIKSEEASTSDRRTALEQLANAYPEAALNMAVSLIGDKDEIIATDSTQFLADSLAMTDFRMGLNTMPEGAGLVMERIEVAKSALRLALIDERIAIRDVAAISLASLGDKVALDRINFAVEAGIYSPVEAVNYFALAQAEIGSRYIKPFLDANSSDAKMAAISYLGAIPQYQAHIREELLLNVEVTPEVRAKAAEVLSRYDDDYSRYALTAAIDPKVPLKVYGAVISGYVDSSERLKTLSTAEAKLLKHSVEMALNIRPDNQDLLMLNEKLERF